MLQLKYSLPDSCFQKPSNGTQHRVLQVSLGLNNIWGHAAVTLPADTDIVNALLAVLDVKAPMIRRFAFTDNQRFWHFLHHLLPDSPQLVAVLDIAAWQLGARLRRTPMLHGTGVNIAHPAPVFTYCSQDFTQTATAEQNDERRYLVLEDSNAAAAVSFICSAPEHQYIIEFAADTLPDTIATTLQAVPVSSVWAAVIPISALTASWLPTTKIPIYASGDKADLNLLANKATGISLSLPAIGGLTPALKTIHDARVLGLKVMLSAGIRCVPEHDIYQQLLSAFDLCTICNAVSETDLL
jgi:L-Ala-D/L-Glu epimerase